MTSFSPFRNESDAITIGDLKIENREDRIAVYGSLAIMRDRTGLAGAKALKNILEGIIKELEGEHDLPVRVAAAETPVKVNNPFA
jgi:hypothetical protein